jgi:uncharacterized protein YecE (DUF72 family)
MNASNDKRRAPRSHQLARIPEADPELLLKMSSLAESAPNPAVHRNVLIGTAGWTDPTLIKPGVFYPRGVHTSRGRLEFYAQHFQLVEVDATYYSLLPAEAAEHWAEWTPASFRFDVKAFPVLTGHPIEVTRLPADLKQAFEAAGFRARVYPNKLPAELASELELRFRLLLEPLLRTGKLARVFLQFPPWFTATSGNARNLEDLAARWHDVPMAVEFRHKSWLLPERRERTFDLLQRCDLAYVCVDEPDVAAGGVPPILKVTDRRLAILRLHGKNVAGWQKKGASVHERFNYLYSAEELTAWTDPLKRLSAEAEHVHVVFNNCVRNYAVLSAKGLAVLLEQ